MAESIVRQMIDEVILRAQGFGFGNLEDAVEDLIDTMRTGDVDLRDEVERLKKENALLRNVASTGRDLIAAQQQAGMDVTAEVERLRDENDELRQRAAQWQQLCDLLGLAKATHPHYISDELYQMRNALTYIAQRGSAMLGTPLGTPRQERSIWQDMGKRAMQAVNWGATVSSSMSSKP